MSNPYGEPKNGDFVAYLREIEKRQLAAMQRPHAPVTPAQAAAASSAAARGGDGKALSAEEAKQLVEKLRSGGLKLSTFDLVRLVFGGVFLISALFGDGGLIAFAIAFALLWTPVRRIGALMRGAAEARDKSAHDALASVFGRGGSAPTKAAPPAQTARKPNQRKT